MTQEVPVTVPIPKSAVRVNRPALALLAIIASLIGAVPALLLLARPLWLLYLSVAAVVVATIQVLRRRRAETMATYTPTLPEFILAGIGMIFNWASTGLIAVLAYAAGNGAVRLLALPAGWVGLSLRQHADPVGIWIAGAAWIVVGLSTFVVGLRNMEDQLYPDAAGFRSAFFDQSSHWRLKSLMHARTRLWAVVFGNRPVGACVPGAVSFLAQGVLPRVRRSPCCSARFP